MIPLLLWRCPLCAANDALTHIERWLRPDLVRCRACQAEWRVRRIPGDNFYLKVVKAASGAGDERSITAWYDAMKQTVRLVPLDAGELALEAGETLYLASRPADLEAEEGDPWFASASGSTRVDKRQVGGKLVGRGRLLLTNRRLIWQGQEMQRAFPLERVNSALAWLNYGVMFLIELRLYMVYFRQESPLKWIHYIALVARQVQAETGHRITTSHF